MVYFVLLFCVPCGVCVADGGIEFRVKPKLCVLRAKEAHCHDTLEFVWSSPEKKSVCLFGSQMDLPMRCWRRQTEGRYSVAITTGDDIEFQLREVDDSAVLVVETFQVVQDKQEFRRRRRNPWSFF